MHGLIPLSVRQQGVATVLVLSLVAGLALMVTAMVGTSRLDMQLLYAQREQMQASAYFDGVTHLMLREYLVARQSAAADQSVVFSQNIEFAGKRFQASVYPLDGLVDIRAAPANTIAALFVNLGGLQADYARSLASAIIRYREQGNDIIGGGAVVMDNIDDLMAVPGMRREILEQAGFAMRASGVFSPVPDRSMLPAELAGPFATLVADGETSPAAGTVGAGSAMLQLSMSYETDNGRRAIGHYRVILDDGQYGIPWRITRRFSPQFKSRTD